MQRLPAALGIVPSEQFIHLFAHCCEGGEAGTQSCSVCLGQLVHWAHLHKLMYRKWYTVLLASCWFLWFESSHQQVLNWTFPVSCASRLTMPHTLQYWLTFLHTSSILYPLYVLLSTCANWLIQLWLGGWMKLFGAQELLIRTRATSYIKYPHQLYKVSPHTVCVSWL